jgi:hypothetical protein
MGAWSRWTDPRETGLIGTALGAYRVRSINRLGAVATSRSIGIDISLKMTVMLKDQAS